MEYPIRFILQLCAIVKNHFLLQSAFGKTSMLSVADKSLEMVLGVNITNAMQIASSAESVSNDICFARMITNLTVVIIKKFNPSALAHIQFLLTQDVLQALMVCEDRTLGTTKVVSPNL
ncbi:hypothetical protein HanRHA438_Chr13g0591501 [Helianthus annuus]|nr:hypothetical protein HanRHA438_Chr13g0591501 [Helianthus annuus]